MLRKTLYLAYGVTCYLVFFATFLYLVGFVAGVAVPKSVNGGGAGDGVEGPLWQAVLIDCGLIALFGFQHSIMARQRFKRAWTRIVPKPLERSTFVLFASLVLIFMFTQWRPIGGVVWEIGNPELAAAVQMLGALGWCLVLVTTFLIDHFDLFGLRQVYLFAAGRAHEEPRFRTPAVYHFVRHPLYLGFLIAFWAAPVMTPARLVFAVLMTTYILIAIRFEERDLLLIHGGAYRRYRESVPMILPLEIGRRRNLAADERGFTPVE